MDTQHNTSHTNANLSSVVCTVSESRRRRRQSQLKHRVVVSIHQPLVRSFVVDLFRKAVSSFGKHFSQSIHTRAWLGKSPFSFLIRILSRSAVFSPSSEEFSIIPAIVVGRGFSGGFPRDFRSRFRFHFRDSVVQCVLSPRRPEIGVDASDSVIIFCGEEVQ